MKRILIVLCCTLTVLLVGCATTTPQTMLAPTPAQSSFLPPSPIYMSEPSLPPEVRAAGVRGVVLVEWLVGEDGDVKEVKIIDSPDHRLSALVSQAVSNWKFKPARRDGKPVENRMRLDISFN